MKAAFSQKAALSQMVLMGAIVATMLYFPLAIAVALVLAVFGIPYGTVATFGGAFGLWAGFFVWWLIAFSGATLYAAIAFPWSDSA